MLKKHSQLFENLLFMTDLVIIALSWAASYYIRFYGGVFPVEKGIPGFRGYAYLIAPIVVIWGFAFKAFGLYRPKRISTYLSEALDITKACVASALVLVTLTFFLRQYEFSRLVFLFFTAMNVTALTLSRVTFREVLRYLRRKGYNLRYAIVVGTGEPAREILRRLDRHPEVGIKVEGVVSSESEALDKRMVAGAKVIGTYGEVGEIVRKRRIDKVFVALSWDEHPRVLDILKGIGDEAVDINVIPDIYEFITLGGGVEEFDGLPILNLQNTPLYGWNSLLKRGADVVMAGTAILMLSPLMAAIWAAIKLTSPGPVLFRQVRVSIGGDTFEMLKFRSMRVDAEKDSGAVWAVEDDPRRTAVGRFLRKTSLDELPQLFNVLRGDMSLVGPRPERPVFIEEFRKHVPRYMLRHKMKAGITGWAQVNGWRGNTDIKKRIEHDLYYIENWSLSFDLKILWLTVWKGLINRNAY